MSTISTDRFLEGKLELAPWLRSQDRQYELTDSSLAIRNLRWLAESTGLPFFCVDAYSGSVLARTRPDLLELLPWSVRSELVGLNGVGLFEQPSGLMFYAVSLPELDGIPVTAVGYVLNPDRSNPEESHQALREMTMTLGWSDAEFERWRSAQPYCQPQLLERLLVSAVESRGRETWMQAEIGQLVREVERAWEEINVVHNLTRELHLTRSSTQLAEHCLDGICQFIGTEGNLILIGDAFAKQTESEAQPKVITRGGMALDRSVLTELLDRLSSQNWTSPLVQNDTVDWPFESDSRIRNFILARISSDTMDAGWILLCNLPEGKEFGPVEATLLQSMGTLLATHRQNRVLFRELDNLPVQFVSSLVSTLDARDSCTRGHSERVAGIARRIGEEIGLSEKELSDLYQSGLLHDIGKIGIHDAILQKEGRLTREEFEEVRKHPEIGFRILSGLKNLRSVLPGVRSHHENYAGDGYPDGLAGESIPLMARILGVADAYDAMRSDRPYRRGMPVFRIEQLFRADAGQQWDPRIIDAYFRCRDEIYELGRSGTRCVE